MPSPTIHTSPAELPHTPLRSGRFFPTGNAATDVKKELAARVVADFHSAADARQAAEDFAREVQQGGVPSDIETVPMPADALSDRGLNVAKMLVACGLAPSRTESLACSTR